MRLDYALFMAEAENCFPDQREESLDAAIRDFRAIREDGRNPNDYIKQVLASHNLKQCLLSDSEIDYINRAVNN